MHVFFTIDSRAQAIATGSEAQAAQVGQDDATSTLVQPIINDEDVVDLTLLEPEPPPPFTLYHL